MKMLLTRKSRIAAVVCIVSFAGATGAWFVHRQRCGRDTAILQGRIRGADRLEITLFNLTRPKESQIVTVLEDPNHIRQLAESVEVTGGRQSNVEVAISDTFLIRTIRGQESRDIMLRGPETVRWEDGSLSSISRKLMKTLRDLVAKQGRVFPRLGASRDADYWRGDENK